MKRYNRKIRLGVFTVAMSVTFLTLISCTTIPLERAKYNGYAKSCGERFPEVIENPDAAGGIAYFSESDGIFSTRDILCLYGSLNDIKLQETLLFLEKFKSFDYVVLRSTGGDVEIWLSLSEMLLGRVDSVIVNGICISSCANYAFLSAPNKNVMPESLVVWHGGPVSHADIDSVFIGDNTPEVEPKSLHQLADRTVNYYSRIQVNHLLLVDTSKKTFGLTERAFLKAHDIDKSLRFSGYALDPYVLENCYNVTGLAGMWYPQDYSILYNLGQARSKEMRLLQRPQALDNAQCALDGLLLPEP